MRKLVTGLIVVMLVAPPWGPVRARSAAPMNDGRIAAGEVLRVNVPEAFGGKTVVGQLTVDRAIGAGYVTAYGCSDGLPTDIAGNVTRSDLNYDDTVSAVSSNRLIVKADNSGDVCFHTLRPVALIIDVNAVTFDTGINSFPNQRTDTRSATGDGLIPAGGVLQVSLPEARRGKTVVGQLTIDRAVDRGFVTAYGCGDGLPTDTAGNITRSDLNYDGRVSPVSSNRLIVKADDNGQICLYTSQSAALIVDLNGVSDIGIGSFDNQRTDTRNTTGDGLVTAGGVLRIRVPQAFGGGTVIGQLTSDRVTGAGFVTAYGCDDGLPTDSAGGVSRSDLNYDGPVSPVSSNRLIVKADNNGDICLFTSQRAALVIDINGVSDVGISSFPNQRTDTRAPAAPSAPVGSRDVPVWPPYEPVPALAGIAALTGLPADSLVTGRPILAVKIDNYGPARPQWGLESADAVIEVNVEGVTRFIALFQTQLPEFVGPVRSARTGDLDLLTMMNRPVFAYSGANLGVTEWINSASGSDLLIDFTAQRSPCYLRTPDRPGPHNLLLNPACAVDAATGAGPARPLWHIDRSWTPPGDAAAVIDTSFTVAMDGVGVEWAWDDATGRYLRFQDGEAHTSVAGSQITADNVVEIASIHIPSPADARSPSPNTVGEGTAIVHRDGLAIPALWSRSTAYDPFEFVDVATGAPIPLDAGITFIEVGRA